MASNRNKLIGQGLPGDANFRAGDVGDTQTIQWSTAENKWRATDFPTIDLGADYTWTGKHVFQGEVDFTNLVSFSNTVTFNGDTNFTGTNGFGGTNNFTGDNTFSGTNNFTTSVTFGATTTFNALATFNNDATVQDKLTITGGSSNNTEGTLALECRGTSNDIAANIDFFNLNGSADDHFLDIDCTRGGTNEGAQVRLFRSTDVGSDNAYFFIHKADGSTDLSFRHWVGVGCYTYENMYVEGKDLYVRDSSNQTSCRITQAGDMALGSQSSSSTCNLDLHSSGRSTYDVRMQSVGGTSTSGRGDFSLTADIIYNYANSNARFYVANDEKFRVAGAQVTAYEPIVVDPPSGRTFSLICDNPGTSSTTQVFRVRTSSGSNRMYVRGDGNCYNTNNVYSGISDENFKEDILDEDYGLAEINQLRSISYKLKEPYRTEGDLTRQIGFSAQELRTIIPEAVEWHEALDDEGGTFPAHYTVNQMALIPVLVNAVKELTARVEELENGDPT